MQTNTTENKPIILGYWAFQGRSEVIKLLLNYLELNYVNKLHTDFQKWFKEEKWQLDIKFPNLPYLIDGDFKLTESLAIIQYIIKKSGKTELLGKDLIDQARVMQLYSIIDELREKIVKIIKAPKDELKATQEELITSSFKPKLAQIEEFIGDRSTLLEYLTFPDFCMYQILVYLREIEPELIKEKSCFQRLTDYINSLEQIKRYKSSKIYNSCILPPGLNYCSCKKEDMEAYIKLQIDKE